MFFKEKIYSLFVFFITFIFLFNFNYIYADDLIEEDNSNNYFEITNSLLSAETSSNVSSLHTPDLNSRSCVVIDRLSKYILFGKNETNKVKMASTTKIMTAIIVIENSSLDKTIEVSKKAAGTGGSRLGLKANDKITIKDLLYGLMLRSGNDAAVCLAENIAGSVPEFANLMNKKANELSLDNTHFESPHGLDSSEHYTTAYELALLSDYALKNETFLKIVSTKTCSITINGYPKILTNTNELLENLNGVYGIKTGFTNGANRCLVTACKRGDMDIICVVLGADTKNFRTKDSIKLIEYSFKNFEYFNIQNYANIEIDNWKANNPDHFFIEKGVTNKLDIELDSEIDKTPIIPIRKDLKNNLEISISINSNLIAPVAKKTSIGNLKIKSCGIDISEFNIVAKKTIEKKNIINYFLTFIKTYPLELKNHIF